VCSDTAAEGPDPLSEDSEEELPPDSLQQHEKMESTDQSDQLSQPPSFGADPAETESDISVSDIDIRLQQLTNFVPPSAHASVHEKLKFMTLHPVQPSETDVEIDLPFKPRKTYMRTAADGTIVQRKWLSYCPQNNKVFCSVCMAFSAGSKKDMALINGYEVNVKHLYRVLTIHESSKGHEQAAMAYVIASKNADIGTLINKAQMDKRKTDIDFRRKVIGRLIDIILFIGKQGLAFRGKREEAAADLNNEAVNHGNFLQLVLLLCKYDQILNTHLSHAIKLSKERREHAKDKGRGSLITFLSKSFINKVIKYLAIQIQTNIAYEIKLAGLFSIEVDSTQDIAVVEQLAVCVRYVHQGEVRVRLLKMIAAEKTSGEALYVNIKSQLEKFGLSTAHIVGCSFDGAANMSGQYNGLQAQLKKDNANVQYVHCCAHALNLVMTDCTECCKVAKDFLGLLQTTAVCLSQSYKRMQVWKKINKDSTTGNQLLRRLQKVNATRWWSKDRALQSILDDPSVPLNDSKKFLTLLICLHTIGNLEDFNADATFQANSLLANWCKFQNILVAFVFRDMFNSSTPTSKYLQTNGIDLLTASNKVKTLQSQLLTMRNNFDLIHENALKFAIHTQEQLKQKGYANAIEVDNALPEKRIAIPKRQADDIATDETRSLASSPLKAFQINVFNIVIDTAQQQLTRRFASNEQLMTDIAWLDPGRFNEVKKLTVLPEGILYTLSHFSNVQQAEIRRELLQFAKHYDDYRTSLVQQDNVRIGTDHDQQSKSTATPSDQPNVDDEPDDELEEPFDEFHENDEMHCNVKSKCQKCLPCAMKLLYELNSLGPIYPSLYIAYKFILTLSCTQVSCERVFSVLKVVKHRLRSSLGQDLLEDFVLFHVERDFQFDYDKVINDVASSSTELSRNLMV
jgi:hypothetical protein